MEKADLKTLSFTVSSSDFLLGMPKKQVDEIVRQGKLQQLQSGTVLFRQGDPATRSFLVLTGRLKLGKLHELGKEVLIRYIGPGELTAMITVLEGREYPVSAEAVGATQVVGWDKQTMLDFMATYPPVALNMIRNSLDRLEDLQSRYLELHAEQVEQRIARSLLRLMKQSGKRSGDEILIDFPISRQELADYTGTTLYTVSRTLSAWEKKGWVKSKREQIIIANPHALVLFSENAG
ncbi:MAG: Crp/Fnr family transcriptional regulator [Syntrophales bacterium]|jgi:CRP-like cAMP-binding protein|nr:Crp/Fnr family transcriptional regulator [Syntrophales bacterium]